MMRWLFTAIAGLTCAVLIPVNVTYNLRNVKSRDRDALSMLTIRDVSGNLLFVHVAVTYIVCGLVMGFIWYHWKVVVRLRLQWFRSPEYMQSFYARTLMVDDVPRKLQTDEGIKAIFESTQAPYPTTSVHVGRSVGRLPELIEFHNQAVRELEQALVKYLKSGKIGKRRPMIRIGGFWGMGGKKMDAIDYYTYVLRHVHQTQPDSLTLVFHPQRQTPTDGDSRRTVPSTSRQEQGRTVWLCVHGCCSIRAHRRQHA